jgi:hypothetical protein
MVQEINPSKGEQRCAPLKIPTTQIYTSTIYTTQCVTIHSIAWWVNVMNLHLFAPPES